MSSHIHSLNKYGAGGQNAHNAAGVLRDVLAIALAVAFLTAAAHIRVPMWPVPMTMQTLAVLSIGAALGPVRGGVALTVYLLLGLLGLSMFAGSDAGATGLAYFAGPTGGYLVGFLVAAIVVGALLRSGWNQTTLGFLGALLLGNAAIYAFGLAWMGVLFGDQKSLTWILQYGMFNFLPGDLIKMFLLAAVVGLWRSTSKRAA